MSVQITPLDAPLGARVEGMDLRQPIDAQTLAAVNAAIETYAVLVFPGQPVSDEQMAGFTSKFGPAQISYAAVVGPSKGWKRRIERNDFFDISNVDENGNLISEDDDRKIYARFNATWHADTTYKQIPTMFAFLVARELPPVDSHTQWADMRGAYDDLPQSMKDRIDGLVGIHSQVYSRGNLGYTKFTPEELIQFPPVPQPLVRVQASSGRKHLYLCSHLSHIDGMPEDEGRALIKELTAHATQDKYIYQHTWTVADFVMWDNRTTMHRAMPYNDQKYRRVLARQGVDEDRPPIEAMRELLG